MHFWMCLPTSGIGTKWGFFFSPALMFPVFKMVACYVGILARQSARRDLLWTALGSKIVTYYFLGRFCLLLVRFLGSLLVRSSHKSEQDSIRPGEAPDHEESKSIGCPKQPCHDGQEYLDRRHCLCSRHQLLEIRWGEEHDEGQDLSLALGDLLLERGNDSPKKAT